MPLYAFVCEGCACRFEELQRADAPAPPCPNCDARDVQRLLSTFVAGPGRKPPSTFTPAATRRDRLGGGHQHPH
ncbi:MAG: zinc ribbon domain-containing protein [Actinomycetota bacterium]|nr:zinc ribbon domain-containing protein [Actinomycetota bacterium]